MTWIVGTCGWLEGFLCVFVCSATVSDHHRDVGDGHACCDNGHAGDGDEDEDEDGVEVERERTMVGQRRIWGGEMDAISQSPGEAPINKN